MIALEVKINGQRVCVAGADDLHVLNASFGIGGKLGPNTKTARDSGIAPTPTLHVGGVTSSPDRDGDHLRWARSAVVSIGDVVELRFIDVDPSTLDIAEPERTPRGVTARPYVEMGKALYRALRDPPEPGGP
jgi:hypothetical protein